MEDLERYLNEVVDQTIKDFEANRLSVRHAFIACVTVFHAIDYLAYPKRSRSLRQQFGKQCLAFAVVDDIAHAFKHVVAGDRGNPSLRADEVIRGRPRIGAWPFGIYRAGTIRLAA